MSDLHAQIDEVSDRIDEVDTSVQDLSDSTDNALNDTQTNIQDLSSAVDDLQQSAGQLSFPLTQDTIDLISEQAPSITSYLVKNGYVGQVVIGGASTTVVSDKVNADSIILLSRKDAGGTMGHLSYSATSGSFTIYSSNVADNSNVIYFIMS